MSEVLPRTARWALLVEYHGGLFVGWQRQAVGVSVQTVLERAARHLAGGAAVPCVAAGRTDSGVHARGQVVHLDLPDKDGLTAHRVRDALNFHMKPHPVAVLAAARVAANWSARFDAVERSYLYRILNRAARPALDAGIAWHVRQALDASAMQEGADRLVGRHDFTSFRASACQAKSPVRTMDLLEVTRRGDWIEIRAEARSFLHHQVRNMVGTLKLVGVGDWQPARISAALLACDRAAGGPTAPPEGLTLTRVGYAMDPFGLRPNPPKGSRPLETQLLDSQGEP